MLDRADRRKAHRAWETFAHGADVGVRGSGATLAESFANAAIALTSVTTDPTRVRARRSLRIACAAPDPEVLFYDWLNALVSAAATEQMVFGRFDVTIADQALTADVWGEAIEPARHRPKIEVKGATFTELAVRPDPGGGWIAQCVVDV